VNKLLKILPRHLENRGMSTTDVQKDRDIKVGDKVLVLLPTDSIKVLMQWRGPFVILENVGRADYRINMNSKIKAFHTGQSAHVEDENRLSVSMLVNYLYDETEGYIHKFPITKASEWPEHIDINRK